METKLIAGVKIDQVQVVQLDENKDNRGSFTEVFQDYWGTVIHPVQWSIVKSESNVFRGMHYHRRHDEYFMLLAGHALVGLKDLREDSPTFDAFSLFECFGGDPTAIIFPRGLLHGWYFYEPSIHLQGVSESYKDYNDDDNLGCRWDCTELGIPWPIDSVVLSERAANFPSLPVLKSALHIYQTL